MADSKGQQHDLVEVRALPVTELELRDAGDGKVTLDGMGIPYETRSQPLWDFVEIIKAGAFSRSLKKRGREVKSFINHDPGMVLATTKSDPPLRLTEGADGVRYELEIPDTSYGQDLQKNIRSKRVKGSSFAFSVSKGGDKWYEDDKGVMIREIREAELYEVGPVTNPAYLETEIQLRSAETVYKRYLETRADGDNGGTPPSSPPGKEPPGEGPPGQAQQQQTDDDKEARQMAGLLHRAKCGELSDADRVAIQSTIDTLTGYLADNGGDGRASDSPGTGADEARARLEALNRRLAMAEREVM